MSLSRDGRCHPVFANGRYGMAWPRAERPAPMSLEELEGYADGLALDGDLSEATRLRREIAVLKQIAESLRGGSRRGTNAKESR